MQTVCDVTYWFIIFFIVAAFANQAELVLGLFLRGWAGGSVHQRAGPRVGSGQTLRVSPTSSWSSRRASRCLSGLRRFKQWQLIPSGGEIQNKQVGIFICR